jgi:ribose-phosphate pyrophosphokinase
VEKKFTAEEAQDIVIASGFAHPDLAREIAESVGMEPGDVKEKMHPNSEIYTRYLESVRGKHVFIVQSHIKGDIDGTPTSVNDAIMEQCLLIDAAQSSSAKEITVVAPYLAYMRQDRKSKGREPIGARVVLDQLAVAGADRIVTVDMHSPQSQAIFRKPFDHLTAQPLLRDAMTEELNGYSREDCVIVAPDAGASKLVEQIQSDMKLGMFVMSKWRDPDNNQIVKREKKVPEADGRVCLIFDDMIDTAGTLVTAVEALKNSNAKAVLVAATHGIFSNPALERLKGAPLEKIIISNTYMTDIAKVELGDKLHVVSVAPMIGRAFVEIVRDGSISDLFHDQNHR